MKKVKWKCESLEEFSNRYIIGVISLIVIVMSIYMIFIL